MRSSTAPEPSALPIAIATPAFVRDIARGWHADGHTIGLVPTMGALHAGHMSLITQACRENDKVVVSVFVNPIQFGPKEDLGRYPRNPARDLAMLRAAGVDAIYKPSVADMYPPGAATRVIVHGVTDKLEGAARPGHFEGVATVVTKLFSATSADRAYFGQKDAQQVAVVMRLARDLDMGVEIRVCPTVREADGLALSSRNANLDPAERKAAVCLSRALGLAAGAYGRGEDDPARLRAILREPIEAEPLARLDYADVVDPANFSTPGSLAVLAVWFGRTRLIDNHDLSLRYPG
ncbi:MAG TPA: pantoate--beta-alanine ligase [Candidatus Dormibacteraeota bacterium]|nr:pantoate--beta-alanine ligase [Candidatus Dormibacteraeota bacterium]